MDVGGCAVQVLVVGCCVLSRRWKCWMVVGVDPGVTDAVGVVKGVVSAGRML